MKGNQECERQVDLQGVFVKIGDFTKFEGFEWNS